MPFCTPFGPVPECGESMSCYKNTFWASEYLSAESALVDRSCLASKGSTALRPSQEPASEGALVSAGAGGEGYPRESVDPMFRTALNAPEPRAPAGMPGYAGHPPPDHNPGEGGTPMTLIYPRVDGVRTVNTASNGAIPGEAPPQPARPDDARDGGRDRPCARARTPVLTSRTSLYTCRSQCLCTLMNSS